MLLDTKLLKPRLPDRLIERESVLQVVDTALERTLTLVSAPPGYGKTTLVAQWLERRQLPHAWLSLDSHDNSPGAFWRALCAALGKYEARLFERVWPSFNPLEGTEVEAGIQALVRELMDYSRTWKAPRRLVLVLDDFHVIDDAKLLQQFNHFLDYCPDILRCVLTTRYDPPLDLPRRRVRHQLQEVRADDLRFDLAAADRFLTQRLGLMLSHASLRMLLDKTEGWVAALQLAGLSLAGQNQAGQSLGGRTMSSDKESLSLLQDFGGHNQLLSDYLLAEVFSRQSAVVQSFLRDIALATRFSAKFCDAVLQRGDSAVIIQEISQRNLLIQPLDDSGEWFRLHDLFRDWLLQQKPAAERVIELGARAATWFGEQGLWMESLDQWLQLRDWERAAAVVARSLETWLQQGTVMGAERVLGHFPAVWIAHNPWLGFLNATQQFNRGDYAGSGRALDRVAQCLELGPPWLPPDVAAEQASDAEEQHLQVLETWAPAPRLMPIITIFRGHLARFAGDLETASRLARQIQEQGSEDASIYAWILHGIGADHFVQGDLNQASEFLVRSMHASVARQDRFCQLANLSWLVPAFLHQGELNLAWSWTERVQEELGSAWREHPLAATLPFFRASVLRERNRLDAAWQELSEAYALGGANISAVNRIYFGFLRWSLCLHRRDLEGADATIEELELLHSVQGTPWSYVVPDIASMRAITQVARGDVSALVRWSLEVDLTDDTGPPMRHWVERLMWVRGHLLLRQNVLEELYAVRQQAQRGGIRGRVLQTWVVEAASWWGEGQQTEAQRCMVEALKISAACGFTRSFLDEGPMVGTLLQACLNQPMVAQEARRLLEELGGNAPQRPEAPVVVANPVVESLSDREREVLRLLDSGLTNKALSEALGIAPATVKAHLHNIFGKLGVSSRTQALAQARSMGLLAFN